MILYEFTINLEIAFILAAVLSVNLNMDFMRISLLFVVKNGNIETIWILEMDYCLFAKD